MMTIDNRGKAWKSAPGRKFTARRFLLLVVVALLMLTATWAFRGNREQVVYQGRPLDPYFVDLIRPTNSPQYVAARDAIVDLNEKALPTIETIIKRGVPWPAKAYYRWQGKLPLKARNWIYRRTQPYQYQNKVRGALNAVSILGTNAAPLAPFLGRAFARGDYQERAALAQVMPKIGHAIVPELTPFLDDPDLRTRGLAVFVFYQLGPQAAESADALASGLAGADENHRRLVAQTLNRMGSRAFPVVNNLLANHDPSRREVGLQAMAGMLPRSLESTPMIIGMLDDPDPDVRLQAALLVTDWWPMPASFLKEKFDALPAGHPSRVKYNASIEALEANGPRLRSVLHEGLRAKPELRLRAARRLLDLGDVDAQLIACLEELAAEPRAPTNQGNYLKSLLEKARQQMPDGVSPETDPRPRTVEAGKSPPSTGRPPADK